MLKKNQLTLLCQMEILLTASFTCDSVNDEEFKEACCAIEEAYGIDSDSLTANIYMFSKSKKTGRKLVSRLVLEFISENVQNQVAYLNLLRLFKTIPVFTASAKWSFIVLKRVENYLKTQQSKNIWHTYHWLPLK